MTNIRRGLLRGWVVFSVVWFLSMSGISAWRVFGEPPCYAFDAITLNENYKGEGLNYVKHLRDELLKNRNLCGVHTTTQLLSLEGYAKDKAISQIAFAWKEPNGWSTNTQAMLEVLDNEEITVSRITGDVAKFVYKSRLHNQVSFLLIMGMVPFLALGIGAGVYWVVLGFRKS